MKREYAHISIHALREEGDGWLDDQRQRLFPISIHALREEGDVIECAQSVQ